jgi:soluble P-type ATPase
VIEISVPGFRDLKLAHAVFDYNGTLAVDGLLVENVAERLQVLAQRMTVHVLTADTFGKVKSQLSGLPCQISVLPEAAQDLAKRDVVRQLGAAQTVAVGNGRNDALMLQEATLGVAVMLAEGLAGRTLATADVVCCNIDDALALFDNPLRLVATLRC